MQKENNLTAGQWCDHWFTANRHKWNSNTEGGYRNLIYSHIIPSIGGVVLSGLTKQTIINFYDSLRSQGLGARSVWCVHLLLRRCMDEAAQDQLIPYNPVRLCQEPKAEEYKTAPLRLGQLQRYLNAAEQLGVLPLIYTGLRQGELIALKWSDLDTESRTLTIAENRAVVRRELVEHGSQTRTIALTPEVIDLLIREHDKHPSSPLMFMHPATLKPYSPQMVRRMHNEIIKEAGIDHIRYVDLRHTCAILALKNGMDTKELAQMLGHYRPTITRQNYEPYLLYTAKKDADMPKEATQSELQQAANILDNLLKF